MTLALSDLQGLRVLIVDPSADTHEVLSTALASRGMQPLLASDAAAGLQHACQSQPDLVVLDAECLSEHSNEAAEFATATNHLGGRLIVLGSLRRQQELFRASSFVSKPYHYGPLIRTIEALLQQVGECPSAQQGRSRVLPS